MERHERYDPEDIENLLNERGFDELLDEERAYVLRHISGREEYEQMRALLDQVRHDQRSREPIESDPAIRDRVLAAFRERQQPQWRIWLNSISLWLLPKETGAYWRPALAFASLALVVAAGILLVDRQGLSTGEQVAELREELIKPDGQIVAIPPTSTISQELSAEDDNRIQERSILTLSDVAEDEADIQSLSATEVAAVRDNMAPQSEALMEDAEVREEKLITFHAAPAEKESRSQLGEVTRSREVTEAELARNMSTTNATGKVQATRKMESAYSPAQSRNMAQDQGLIAMLSTGW